jgi:hypothetical protein
MTQDGVHSVLRFRFNERFSVEELPEELEENKLVSKCERDTIICPEGGCSKRVNIADTDPRMFLCSDGHTNPYDETQHYYFKVKTADAIENLLDTIGVEGETKRDGNISVVDEGRSTFLIIPGDFQEVLHQDLGNYITERRNICILTFEEDCRGEVKRFIDRFGGLSMVVKPPNLERKVSKFKSLVEMRDSVETEYLPEKEEIPEELVQNIHDNPQFAVGELVNYEKIEGNKEERERMEQLSTLAFSQLMNFPLNSLGMMDRGSRVPDGFGFIFDRDGSNDPLIMLDSKSVSSKNRDYPNITEADDAQYRKYLEKAEKISYKHGISERVLIFISSEYNLNKVQDFLDELNRSELDDFRVLFLKLEALATLLLLRNTHVVDRKIRLDQGRWVQLLHNLVMEPDFERDDMDYELEKMNANLIDRNVVLEHFSENIDEQQNKEELLEEVEEKFKEFDPYEG